MGKPATTKKTTAPKPTATEKPKVDAASGGALDNAEDDDGDDMIENSQSLHQGLHVDQEADLHFGESIHDEDQMPEDWKPPSDLQAPAPRVGMVQRWIRKSVLGKQDAENQSRQGRQGWRPRALSSVAEGDRKNYPMIKDTRTGGEFMVSGDLILCEMHERTFNQMTDYYRGKRRAQVGALVDKPLAGAAISGSEKHGMHAPEVIERKSERVTIRRPQVAPDK